MLLFSKQGVTLTRKSDVGDRISFFRPRRASRRDWKKTALPKEIWQRFQEVCSRRSALYNLPRRSRLAWREKETRGLEQVAVVVLVALVALFFLVCRLESFALMGDQETGARKL